MVDYLHRPVAHEAFFKKYASKKFLKGTVSFVLSTTQGSKLTGLYSFHHHTSMGEEVLSHVPR